MKILGKAKDSYIIEASDNELANLMGYYSKYDLKDLPYGAEINISEMYKQLYFLAKNKSLLNETAKKLEEYADNLKLIKPLSVEVK